jgi:acyltransferase
MKRTSWIDVARGLAMLGVLYGHVLPREFGFGKWIYSWHMPVFFVITGILLFANDGWRGRTFRELFVRDLKAIMYPYLVWNVIEAVTMVFRFSLRDAAVGVFHFCMLDGLQTLWFLSALFVARQLLFQMLKRTEKRRGLVLALAVSVVVTAAFSHLGSSGLADGGLVGKLWGFANIANRSVQGFVFLTLGYLGAGCLAGRTISRGEKAAVLVGSVLFGVFAFGFNTVDLRFSKIGNPLLFYPLAIAGSAALFVASEAIAKFRASELLAWIGRNTIVLLVTHIPVRDLLAVLLPTLDTEMKPLFFLVFLAAEAGVVVFFSRYLPWLFHWRPKT